MDPATRLLIKSMQGDISELRKDVKSLLAFKWQMVGGAVVASAISSVFMTVVIQVFFK